MRKSWRMFLSGVLLTAAATYYFKERTNRIRTWNYLKANDSDSIF